MTVIELRPHRWGWKAFEAHGVEPVTHPQWATAPRYVSRFIEYDALHRAKLPNHQGGTRAAPNEHDLWYPSDCRSRIELRLRGSATSFPWLQASPLGLSKAATAKQVFSWGKVCPKRLQDGNLVHHSLKSPLCSCLSIILPA